MLVGLRVEASCACQLRIMSWCVLMISPTFSLVKIGHEETPLFEPTSYSCLELLALSAAIWPMKRIENITAGLESSFLSVSLCTLSEATLVKNCLTNSYDNFAIKINDPILGIMYV